MSGKTHFAGESIRPAHERYPSKSEAIKHGLHHCRNATAMCLGAIGLAGLDERHAFCALEKSKAQWQEDLIMLPALLLARQHAQGVRKFVELGAFDGLTLSNTWMLEQCFGWSGLLVEAYPPNAAKARTNRAGNDQNTVLHQGVCPDEDGMITFTRSSKINAAQGDITEFSDSFRKQWFANSTLESLAKKGVYVKCSPLSTMMRKHATMPMSPGSVPFLSLDVSASPPSPNPWPVIRLLARPLHLH